MDISGKWKGTIVYGKEYGEWENEVLYFELEMQQDGDKISGIAKDVGGFGANETAAHIKGIFLSNRIDFLKQYEAFEIIDGPHLKTIEADNRPLLGYTGLLDAATQTFQGTWAYKPAVSTMPSGKKLRFGKATGTWSMQRLLP